MTEAPFRCIGVVGAGAWGTALANVAARAGREVVLWTRDEAHAAQMASARDNARRLPGVALEPAVRPTADLADLRAADAILLVVPAQAARSVAAALAGRHASGRADGDLRQGDRARQPRLPERCGGRGACRATRGGAVGAVVRRRRGARTADGGDRRGAGRGGRRRRFAPRWRQRPSGSTTRTICAASRSAGRPRTSSPSPAASRRGWGWAPARRPRWWRGASPNCAASPAPSAAATRRSWACRASAISCSPAARLQSRNFALGHALGRGVPPPDKLAEGAFTAGALVEMARERGVEMPISEAVCAVVEGRISVSGAVDTLLARPPRPEA